MYYDLAVLGGGPGGYTAAETAAKAGLRTVLFERKELGGVCLNEGCIPTKTLLYSAKVYDSALSASKYGVDVAETTFDFGKICDRKDKVRKKLVVGVGARMRNAGVDVVRAEAFIAGRNVDGGTEGLNGAGAFIIQADGQSYEAASVLISTGSETVIPPIPGMTQEGTSEAPTGTPETPVVVTNRELLALREQPRNLVIIGGGVIGMEFASFYNSIGSHVTVIEMMPKILGPFDDEISALLQNIYTKRGIDFRLGCTVTAIEGNDVVFRTPVAGPETGQDGIQRVTGDKILVSVGRRANIEGLGLEALGVEFTLGRSGRPTGIKVDSHMRTNVPGLYAVGDVTGFSMLAHTAIREAEVAVHDILAPAGTPAAGDEMNYDAVPSVVYTSPEVASVGLTEAQAAERSIPVVVKKLPMGYSGRFVAENERGEGLCKIICAATENVAARVLGVHMIGTPCSEIITAAAIAVSRGLTAADLQRIIFPHPTVSEILRETINV